MCLKNKFNIALLSATLLLLSACGLNEDEQAVFDTCKLAFKFFNKETCQCMAKKLSKEMDEKDFSELVDFNRSALELKNADKEQLRAMGALTNVFDIIDLTAVRLACEK